MRRRQFLAATTGLSLAALAAGCQSTSADSLKVALLEGSVPPQLIQAFERQLGSGNLSVTPVDSLLKLYALLQGWQEATQPGAEPASKRPVANWVTLGDYWLAPAIRQNLLQPVEVAALDHWQELPEPWAQLVQRDGNGLPDPTGQVWGVPYRWSSLAILYNPDQRSSKSAPITQWADLLRPEFNRRVIVPNHPRLVIGLGLKAVGASANAEDPAAVPGLIDFLQTLHSQVRSYDSDAYLESLIIGDVSAIVGWTAEIQPVLQQYLQFSAVVPAPGTLVGADLWVQPKQAQPHPQTNRWPDFSLTTDFANQLASYTQGVAARFWGLAPDQLPPVLRQQPILSPTAELQANSDFLLPLSEAAHDRYISLWKSLRG